MLSGAAYWMARTYGYGVRYWRTHGAFARQAHRDGAYLRRSYKPLFYDLGLMLKQKRRARSAEGGTPPPKIKYPKLKSIRSDDYGIFADFELVPKVRLKHFQDAAEDLANYYQMVRVTAVQPEPNRVQVRAVRRDPILTKTVAVFPDQPRSHRYYPAGLDDYGMPVDIRLHHSSGLGIFGMPNYGKTSFVLGLITYFAPSDSTVFLIADGKVSIGIEGDYMDVAPRALSVIGDDIFMFNRWIHQIEEIRRMRASMIRHVLGVRNFWDVGPSPEWPMIFVIVDEFHTFVAQSPSGGAQSMQQRNAVTADNAHTMSEVVRKCQSVGIIPVLTTQKGIAEAIPTIIRDSLSTKCSYAVSTDEAAQAALGKDIRSSDASPINFQHEDYVGVMAMLNPSGPGYTRVRTPYTKESVAAKVCGRYEYLVQSAVCPGLSVGLEHRPELSADDELDFTLEAIEMSKEQA